MDYMPLSLLLYKSDAFKLHDVLIASAVRDQIFLVLPTSSQEGPVTITMQEMDAEYPEYLSLSPVITTV